MLLQYDRLDIKVTLCTFDILYWTHKIIYVCDERE